MSESFEAAYRADDNHWWASQSGDCQNAYDAALEELDHLRAAVAAVRELADEWAQGTSASYAHGPMYAGRLHAALDAVQPQPAGDPEPAAHEYLSTGCYHGEHGYCQSMTGYQGEKRPGRCKFCDARCTCSCHEVVAG